MTQTLVDYIEQKLAAAPENVSIEAIRSTADENDGVYTINLAWMKRTGDKNYHQLPTCEPDQHTFFLTDDEEFKVKPTFRKEQRTVDAAMHDELPYFGLDNHDSTVSSHGIKQLKQTFREIHMSEEQLINFAEGDGSFARGADFVFVRKATEKSQKLGVTPIKFDFYTRYGHEHQLDNMLMKKRFSHVSTITLSGDEYPVIIDYTSYGEDPPSGAPIYVSEFVADADGGPQWSLEKELQRVDWEAYYESDDTIPGYLQKRQSNPLMLS